MWPFHGKKSLEDWIAATAAHKLFPLLLSFVAHIQTSPQSRLNYDSSVIRKERTKNERTAYQGVWQLLRTRASRLWWVLTSGLDNIIAGSRAQIITSRFIFILIKSPSPGVNTRASHYYSSLLTTHCRCGVTLLQLHRPYSYQAAFHSLQQSLHLLHIAMFQQQSDMASKEVRHRFRGTSCAVSRCHGRPTVLNTSTCLCDLFCFGAAVGNSMTSFSLQLMPTGRIHFLPSGPSALQRTAKPLPPHPLGMGQDGALKTTGHRGAPSGGSGWVVLQWGLFPLLVLLVSFSNHQGLTKLFWLPFVLLRFFCSHSRSRAVRIPSNQIILYP